MSLQKFRTTEQRVEVESGELIIYSKANSLLNVGTAAQTFLIDSAGGTNYSADLKVNEVILGNSETQQAEIRIWGYFYLTERGRVFASISLGDRGNGLEAKYAMSNDLYDRNGQFTGFEDIATGSLALTGLTLNTAYRASIDYDGNTGLTFTFNNGAPITVQGPTKFADSPWWRTAGSRLRFGENNSTPLDGNDSLLEDGSTASILGSIDNVSTGGGPSDDFSTTDLNKWNNQPISSLINQEEQLEVTISQTGNELVTQRVRLVPKDLDYFGAKVGISSESTPVGNARLRARITEYLGNDTYDVENGAVSNGSEGEIWTRIALDRNSDGSFVLSAYIERANDADYSDTTELLFQNLIPTRPLAYDELYDMAIEKVGTIINFIFEGEILLSFDLTSSSAFSGNLFKSIGNATQLQSRIQDGPGKVVALFDDIVTQAPITSATTIDIDGNGEVTALTDGLLILRSLFGFSGDSLINGATGTGATRTTASDISAYLSQLTSSDMALDIDGSGDIAALTDGLLVLRSLFGFSGDSLISGALGTGATRNTAADVEAYIQQLKGQ